MSQDQDEIIVDFNVVKRQINNDVIEEVKKPKATRASKQNNIVSEPTEPIEEPPIEQPPIEEPPVEDVKPKPKRASKQIIL